MERFARGLPVQGAKVPRYDPDDESADPRRLDLSEIMDEIDSIKERVGEAEEARKAAYNATIGSNPTQTPAPNSGAGTGSKEPT